MDDVTPPARDAATGALAADTPGAPAALRDAAAVLARVAADEAAARDARARFRGGPIAPIEPDACIAEILAAGEDVLAVRRSALVERRQPPPGTAGWPPGVGLGGDLYVTSSRLALVGRTTLTYDLDAIRDAVVSGERLLLTLRDGAGVIVYVAQPRLLRVEIGAARAKRAGRRRATHDPATPAPCPDVTERKPRDRA